MAKYVFYVRKPRGTWPREGLPAFVLEQDRWNDYGFHTHYHLSYVTVDKDGRINEDLIGPVKILRAGQTDTDKLQVLDHFSKLDEDFCSVGGSLDYYERLRQLPPKRREKVLVGLRDVVANSDIEARFRVEKGWSTSLFRDGKDDSYLKLAKGLLTGDYTELPGNQLEFMFALPKWLKPLNFSFLGHTTEKPSRATRAGLPERIAVLVGQNGSGKSTVLARLARVAFGTIDERDKAPLESLGRIEPSGIGFPRVITVSFSAFDSFRLPGTDGRSRRKILQEMEHGEGRFAFIGLRDIKSEGSRVAKDAESEHDPLEDADRLSATRLKSIEQLTTEFSAYLTRIEDPTKTVQLDSLFESLLIDSAFAPLLKQGLSRSTPKEIRRAFLLCSTGHKIAALVVVGLIATLVPSSLILFDEPETHLHPPLLAALMHALRAILRNHDSYCIIATHSPVVVQESMAKDVKVIRRNGSFTSSATPNSETFGESIGLITSEVFGLNSEATDYHQVLDKLVTRYQDQEDLENLFLNGQMSHQARAYTMSRRLQVKRNKD
ncbi:AAA family ATPase [Pseudomonas fluorescens]|jgi:energy-coupling factor transporter ATP-binding protein EcfA2|uniref:ATP-dependent nuclease n=1 Tax=Pseudomonas fluorescens TaxID=294 RepID=UPI003D0495B2